MMNDAAEIYQDWLDDTSEPIVRADLARLNESHALPFLYHSADNQVLLETYDDLNLGHQSYAESLRAQGVNHLIRLATDAEFLSDNYIEGHHVSHVLRNATPVIPSYTTRIVLRRAGRGWKAIELATSLSAGQWPVRILSSPADAARHVEKFEDDARRLSAEPLALYQAFLNRLTQTNLADDIDAYCRLLHFPVTSHSANSDTTLRGLRDVRAFFESLSRTLQDQEIDGFSRIAEHAEFIGGYELCGYHVARFFRQGTEVLPPIRSRMILRRWGTEWFMNSVTNAVGDPYPYDRMQALAELVTERQIQERTKKWPNLH